MTIASKYITVSYKGIPFFINGKVLYPLQSPVNYLLSTDKTKLLPDEQDQAFISALEARMEIEDVELWLTGSGKVITLMWNFGGASLVALKAKYAAEILSYNEIYFPE